MNTLSDKEILKRELEGIRGLLALMLPRLVSVEQSLKTMETSGLVYQPATTPSSIVASPTSELSSIQRVQSSSVK